MGQNQNKKHPQPIPVLLQKPQTINGSYFTMKLLRRAHVTFLSLFYTRCKMIQNDTERRFLLIFQHTTAKIQTRKQEVTTCVQRMCVGHLFARMVVLYFPSVTDYQLRKNGSVSINILGSPGGFESELHFTVIFDSDMSRFKWDSHRIEYK